MSTYTIYAPLTGGQTDIVIPDPYISQADVEVWTRPHAVVDDGTFTGVQLSQGSDYTWISAGQIRLTVAADGNTDYLVKRNTQRNPVTTQQPGVFSSAKINLNAEQQQYVNEEQDDRLNQALSALAAANLRISSLEAGLDATGFLAQATATETIPDGAFVNLYWNTQLCIRQAVSSDETKWAWGFVKSGGGAGALLSATNMGVNTAVNPASFGEAFLSSTPGQHTLVAPAAVGSIVQPLGLAVPSRGIFFTPQQRILL